MVKKETEEVEEEEEEENKNKYKSIKKSQYYGQNERVKKESNVRNSKKKTKNLMNKG